MSNPFAEFIERAGRAKYGSIWVFLDTANLSRNYISQLKKIDKRRPSQDAILKLAAALEIPIADLVKLSRGVPGLVTVTFTANPSRLSENPVRDVIIQIRLSGLKEGKCIID